MGIVVLIWGILVFVGIAVVHHFADKRSTEAKVREYAVTAMFAYLFFLSFIFVLIIGLLQSC